jgi:alkaline phosphatase
MKAGRIDMAHHFNNAQRALDDFVVFDEAIGKSVLRTKESETLIVVTADHSHGKFLFVLS